MTKIHLKKKAVVFMLILSVLFLTVPTLAWYGGLKYQNVGIDKGTVSYVYRYFESGNGKTDAQITSGYNGENWIANDGFTIDDFNNRTTDAAFEIKTPLQLYNLAWLQYMGYFNAEDDNGELSQTHFYLSQNLDMTGYVLPPIGTTDHPFIGTFDGNGHKISNLAVSDSKVAINASVNSPVPIQVTEETANGNLNGINVMGLFGTVGTIKNGQSSAVEDGTPVPPYIHDVEINNIQVNCSISSQALLGYAAGYVNGILEKVTVSGDNSTLSANANTGKYSENGISPDNLSEYGLVGYAADEYKETVKKSSVSAKKPVVGYNFGGPNGDGTDWGGSVDMFNMHKRLVNVFDAANSDSRTAKEKNGYIDSQIIILNKKNNSETLKNHYTETNAGYTSLSTTYPYLYYDTGGSGGQYNFDSSSNEGNYQYMCLYGENAKFPKNVTIYTLEENDLSAFYISSGSNYLNATDLRSSLPAPESYEEDDGSTFYTTEQGNTKWIFDNGNHLYTIVDGTKYYLTASGRSLSLSSSPSTEWTYSNNTLTTSTGYSLIFSNNAWSLFPSALFSLNNTSTLFYITSGNGHYLSVENGNLTDSTSLSIDCIWIKDSDNHIYTVKGLNTYYLKYNAGKLAVGTTADTAWVSENNRISYTNNDIKYYIDYNTNNTWQLVSGAVMWTIKQNSNNGYYINYPISGSYVGYSQSNPDKWYIDTDGYCYYYDNNNKKYLRFYQQSSRSTVYLYADTTNTNRVKREGDTLKATIGNSTYYVYCANNNNNKWRGRTSSTNLVFTEIAYNINNAAQTTTYSMNNISDTINRTDTAALNISKEVRQNIPSGNNSYYPLSGADTAPFDANEKNTGYVISGANLSSSAGAQANYGDIRVSSYAFNNISSSFDSYDDSSPTVYTRTSSSGGIKTISNSNMYGLEKYEDALKNLLKTFGENTSNIYGLHFMDAKISMEHLVTADTVMINGEEYTNYEMPQDSIDFTLKEKGYINFFAGTYFTGNDSFFSLHKIYRDGNNKITDIKEISKIYRNPDITDSVKDNERINNESFIYLFSDGTMYPENAAASENNLMFDTTWIKNPGFNSTTYRVYYYEIPVNQGEYALGSVDGGTGAYLMYLDIGTSAIPIRKTDVLENITETTETYHRPLGVNFIDEDADKNSIEYINEAALTMPLGATALSASRSGDIINISANIPPTVLYAADGVTIKNGSTTVIPTYASKQKKITSKITDISIEYEVGNRNHETNRVEHETNRVETESSRTETITYLSSGETQSVFNDNNVRETFFERVSQGITNPQYDEDEDGNQVNIYDNYYSYFNHCTEINSLPDVMCYHLWTSNAAEVSASTSAEQDIYIIEENDSKTAVLKTYALTASSSENCMMYVEKFINDSYIIWNIATENIIDHDFDDNPPYNQYLNGSSRTIGENVPIAAS